MPYVNRTQTPWFPCRRNINFCLLRTPYRQKLHYSVTAFSVEAKMQKKTNKQKHQQQQNKARQPTIPTPLARAEFSASLDPSIEHHLVFVHNTAAIHVSFEL